MKRINTQRIGKARIELYSDNNMYIILFRYKEYTYEVLRSKMRLILTDYFYNIKVTDDTLDIVQFYYSHNDDNFIYFEFNYQNEEMKSLDIKLNQYTLEDQEYNITGFYDSLNELNRIYGKDSNQIVAECIFENSNQL